MNGCVKNVVYYSFVNIFFLQVTRRKESGHNIMIYIHNVRTTSTSPMLAYIYDSYHFHLQRTGSIMHVKSGRCLDAKVSTKAGQVFLNKCDGSANQTWTFEKYYDLMGKD